MPAVAFIKYSFNDEIAVAPPSNCLSPRATLRARPPTTASRSQTTMSADGPSASRRKKAADDPATPLPTMPIFAAEARVASQSGASRQPIARLLGGTICV